MLCRTAFRRRVRRGVFGASLHLLGVLRQLLQICEAVRAVGFERGISSYLLMVGSKAILVSIFFGSCEISDWHDELCGLCCCNGELEGRSLKK
jgi:hypothetical protein